MTKRIFTPEVKNLLLEIEGRAYEYGVDSRHLEMIQTAKNHRDLLLVAQASLKKLSNLSQSKEIVFFSGPLRSGPESLYYNLETMWNAIQQEKENRKVFNKLLFFCSLTKLECSKPNLDPMTEFFEPVLEMGKITELTALVGCEYSPNSQREIKKALSLNLFVS